MTDNFSYDDLEAADKAKKEDRQFQRLFFPAGQKVEMAITGTKGVKTSSNGKKYVTLHGVIKNGINQDKKFVYNVWERYEKDDNPCRLITFLLNYYSKGEIVEKRWADDKVFIDRVLGSVISMVPTRVTKNQKTLEDQQNFYGYELVTAAPTVNTAELGEQPKMDDVPF